MDKTVVVVFAILVYLKYASAGGTLSINLIHFENEKSLKPDGTCCDVDGDGKCITCQYYFIICISEPSSQNCSIKRIWTNTLADEEYYVFGDHFYEVPSGEKVQNPINLPVNKWSGEISLKIDAYDEDKGNNEKNHLENDLVCSMLQNLSIKATPIPNEKAAQNVLLLGELRHGGGFPKLTLTVRVHCDTNYLIPACTDYCEDTDDSTGHYRCNYDTGKRECYGGWYGDKCSTECNARNDSFGHYKCDRSTGMKICLSGWRDVSSNCTKSNATHISPSISTTTTTTTTALLNTEETTKLTVTNPKHSLFTSSKTKGPLATSSTTSKFQNCINTTASKLTLTKTSALKSTHHRDVSLVSVTIHGSQLGVMSSMSLKSEIGFTVTTSKHQRTQWIEAFLTTHSLTTNNILTSLETVPLYTREAAKISSVDHLNVHTSTITTTSVQNVSSILGFGTNEARQGSTGKQQKSREQFSSFSPFIISAGIFAIMASLVLFLLFKKKRSTRVRHLSDSNQSNGVKRNYSASMHSTRKEKSFSGSHPNTPIPSRTAVSARTLATPSTPAQLRTPVLTRTLTTPSTPIAPQTPLLSGTLATTITPVHLRTPVLTRTLATPSASVHSRTPVLPRTPQSYQGIEYLTTELCETSLRSWTPSPRTAGSTRSNDMTLLPPGIPFETCPEFQLQGPNSSRTPMPDMTMVLPRTPFQSWTPIPPKTPTEGSSERQN